MQIQFKLLMAYSKNTPDIDKIKNIDISYIQLPNYVYGELKGFRNSRGYYINEDYRYEEKEDKIRVTNIYKKTMEQENKDI